MARKVCEVCGKVMDSKSFARHARRHDSHPSTNGTSEGLVLACDRGEEAQQPIQQDRPPRTKKIRGFEALPPMLHQYSITERLLDVELWATRRGLAERSYIGRDAARAIYPEPVAKGQR